jgi:hypothetical protein
MEYLTLLCQLLTLVIILYFAGWVINKLVNTPQRNCSHKDEIIPLEDKKTYMVHCKECGRTNIYNIGTES